ncbi:MAG: hypothetical protein WDM81_03190 [Rhizomicrobium sp.]
MMVHIPAVLTAQEVAHCREVMSAADWVDGKVTAGEQSAGAKKNLQLAETSPSARELGDLVLGKLGRNEIFTAAALPLRVFPPPVQPLRPRHDLRNAYRQFDPLRGRPAGRFRTDVSATLFLTAPEDYDGGELVVEGHLRQPAVKLPAGDMVLYPARAGTTSPR